MIPPFKWFYTFMDTPQEWHSWVIGLSEVICPWRPMLTKFGLTAPQKELRYVKKEWHYYMFGRASGVFVLVVILGAFIKWIF